MKYVTSTSKNYRIKLLMSHGLIFGAILLSYQNCAKVSVGDSQSSLNEAAGGGDNNPSDPSNLKPTLKTNNDYVCSAFGNVTLPSEKSGLKASLKYIDATSSLSVSTKNAFKAVDYFNSGSNDFKAVEQVIYLGDINVPTRKFDSGFALTDGSLLKDALGSPLIEYFGLKMETVIKLSSSDKAGYYRFASISDDGSRVEILENNQWIELLDNDGQHATQMMCSQKSIYMDQNTKIRMRMYYNQGPRNEISNVLVWNFRDTVSEENISSSNPVFANCGLKSSTQFWSPSTGQSGPWTQANEKVGWKALTSSNYLLPDEEVNPCSFNSYDLKSELVISASTQSRLQLSFKAEDEINGEVRIFQFMSASDKNLINTIPLQNSSKSHDFQIEDLDSKFEYEVSILANVPGKKIKFMKSYKILFTQ